MKRLLIGILFLTFPATSWAETKVPVIKDNSIVMVENEFHLNAGGQRMIRIKGNQHLVALDFDREALKGKVIEKAYLVAFQGDGLIDELTLSTIQADWDEYLSSSLTSGKQGFEGWGWPGARFPSITGSNSFSLVSQAKTILKDKKYYWEIDPDLIYANVIGVSYGLTLHEVSADYSRNPTIYSKESGERAPYLLAVLGDEKIPRPEPPTNLDLKGDMEGLRLHLTAPKNGFAYKIFINGSELPRWNIPFVKTGEEQTIPLRDLVLKPGSWVSIQVLTLNRLGEASEPVTLKIKLPEIRPLPFPKVRSLKGKETKLTVSGLTVIPEIDKYDNNGASIGQLPNDHQYRNEIFDGSRIHLTAAKGEVVGFQVLVKGSGKVMATCELPGIRTELFEAVYVASAKGRVPDPLIPLGKMDLSLNEAKPIFVDVYIPFDFGEKFVRGEFRLSDGRQVPIELEIRDFAIPKKASFLCEMNTYGLSRRITDYYDMQSLGYNHRVHSNVLMYAHRSTKPDRSKSDIVAIKKDGTQTDNGKYNDIKPGQKEGHWDEYMEIFSPFVTGDYFQKGHRGSIAAPGFYLTFHESWPLKVREFYNGDPDAYKAFQEAPLYKETFQNILRDFMKKADGAGWHDAGLQIYLNNKGSFDQIDLSPWILDEPNSYWDYRALAYYADLVREVKGQERGPVKIQFRIDISRPEFTRGVLWGKVDLWVVNEGSFEQYSRLLHDLHEGTGVELWAYGDNNAVEESNRITQNRLISLYRDGAKGYVPWQTRDDKGGAMTNADQNALYIFHPDDSGNWHLDHSMRLKAYRRAEQDIEYLTLLKNKLKLSEGELRRFIDHYLYEGEPAGGGIPGPENFRQLREAAAILIEKTQ